MSIKDIGEKIKGKYLDIKDIIFSEEGGLKISEDIFIVLLILLIGTASFGLGKLSAFEKKKTPISILKTKEAMYATVLDSSQGNYNQGTSNLTDSPENKNTNNSSQKGIVVASKSGTKYYYPWCSGVSRIKEENKVWFVSIEDARSAGLTPASGCTGLK